MIHGTSTLAPLDPLRHSPWEEIGTSVTGSHNAYDALVTAGLADWNIRRVYQTGTDTTEHGVTILKNPEKVMLARTDPGTGESLYLSTVGTSYGIHQNEEAAATIDALVAESGADGLGNAGQLDGGRRVFVTMALPNTMYVAGVDPIQLHLVVFTSHDGTQSFRVMVVPHRVYCANQLSVSIAKQVNSVSIRHTSKSQINIAEIRSSLGLMYNYAEAFESHAARLVDTEMTNAEFDELIAAVWPVTEKNASLRTTNNARRRRSELTRLWSSADTQASIRGTRWAGLQAVGEYLDHTAPAKSDRVRAIRVVSSDEVAKKKQKAFDLLTA